jgi:leader peptidase (prepilin peptidase)/N-methyltransferase
MLPFVDAAVILLLGGVVTLALPPEVFASAAPAACWVALTTPLLVRTDLRERRLPNAATHTGLLIVLLSVVLGAVHPATRGESLIALAFLVASAAGGTALATTGGLGLGDVKLAAALVGGLALVQPWLLIVFALVASATAVGLTVFELRRLGQGAPAVTDDAVQTLFKGAREVPRVDNTPQARPGVAFGPCLLLGYWIALGASVAARLAA